MSIQRGATVEFESLYTAGRFFMGKVRDVMGDYAVVGDERRRWPDTVVKLTRLTYIKPSLKGMRK